LKNILIPYLKTSEMEKAKVKAALQVMNRIDVFSEKIGVEPIDNQSAVDLPTELTVEEAAELLPAIIESSEHQHINEIFESLTKDFNEPTKSGEFIEYAGMAYDFVKNHWGEIFFILSYLDRTGKLDSLKKKKRLKPFFDTLFEKEEDKSDDKKDKDE